MNEDTPWGRFPDLALHQDFAAAYGRLPEDQRVGVDAAIADATGQMHRLLGNSLLKPLLWPGLPPETGRLVDIAVRTCIAMGVFRLCIAGRLGTGRTALSDGLDRAADDVDQRVVMMALHALGEAYPYLLKVKASNGAAYHQLFNHLVRAFQGPAYGVAQSQSDPSAELDLTLETGLRHGGMLSIIVHLEKLRRGVQRNTSAALEGSLLPLEAAVALWLLSLMGLGRVFGEDDQTMAYAD